MGTGGTLLKGCSTVSLVHLIANYMP